MPKAMTLMRMMDTTAKATVNQNAWPKLGSVRARW